MYKTWVCTDEKLINLIFGYYIVKRNSGKNRKVFVLCHLNLLLSVSPNLLFIGGIIQANMERVKMQSSKWVLKNS